ncbi:MAG: phosphate/phosphite/phosphonate ABC transporter substrate-binding protein [Desulfobulbaceae bacterium]|nr:phosphate/phosphite/phosphonate ABC transporter substrate-binding protein [Desulfobulbaceae bacterium]
MKMMMKLSNIRVIGAILFCILASSHFSFAAEYKLSMLPRYSTEEINKRITPLAKYLEKQTGLQITPTLTSTFGQYSKQLSSGGINIGFENPYIYVMTEGLHEVVAMAVKGSDGDKFRGIIITRSDSTLRTLQDLKGKKIAIVGYTSAGGYLSQKLSLLQSEIDVTKDCIIEEAPENKQENVIFAVFTGDVDAGFIRESALNRVDDFVPPGAIRVLKSTEWLPNWALSISSNMPPEDKTKIIKAIQNIKPGTPALKALKIKALKPAIDSDYDTVRIAAGLM